VIGGVSGYNRASKVASSTSAGRGQDNPAVVARRRISATVLRATPQLLAICRWLSWHVSFSRKMSLIFRIVTRSAGIGYSSH
jgi:hypothetical protein